MIEMQQKTDRPSERQLRVLSVCRALPTPEDPSGGIFVQNRLAAMARIADVHVVQPLPWFPAIAPLPLWARKHTRDNRGLLVEHAPMFYLPKILKSLDGAWLERAIRPAIDNFRGAGQIDLIDAHFGYPEGVGCLNLGRKLGIPVFITIRGFETEYVRRPIIGSMLIRAMREATACISVSHSLREMALRHGVESSKIRVIHNAIDRHTFNPGDRAAARARLGAPQAGRLIVSVGHLISRKRHHVLIDAFRRLREHFPSAQLVIIGGKLFESNYPDRLRQQVRDSGLVGAVQFIGNVPPALIADWLRAADVFALGTAREGCCNAVLEALATGIPVVTTPVGDNAYFIKEGENGYLTPVDDSLAMERALRAALQRTEWPHAEIARRLDVGTWENVARLVDAFFREILDLRPASNSSSVLRAAI
jgi:glycosyltransferase involved in cell wall biosynthesis